MINQLVVLNTVQANGADAFVDNQGRFNVNGIGAIPAASVLDVVKIPSSAEQIKKQLITCTSSNSSTYNFVINGYAMSTGLPVNKTITFTSPLVSSTAIVSAGITAAVNLLTDFNVTATDTGSGVVSFIAKTATAACPFAPMFNIQNGDSKITVTAVAATSFTAPPAGGRTAQGYAIIADLGTVTSIVVTDPGMGYLSAPTATVSGGGGGTSGSATTVIFEGEVVGIASVTAGSGYTCREGYTVVGTPAALIAKYGYVASTPNAPGAPAYPALANLTSGYTYTEWIISYTVAPISGITTFAQTSTTGQISILVYESATNAATLNSPWSTLTNLRKGFRSSMADSVATIAFANASGALVDIDCTSTSLALENIQSNDIVALSASAYALVLQPSVILAGTVAIDKAIGYAIGGDESAATMKVVKRYPISR
jgi:hypothetical protein